MTNDFQELFNTYDDVKALVEKDDSQQQDFGSVAKWFEEKKKNPQLSIMVYGVYNAGKSTFINALLGEELAATDDIPLTAKVSAYRYKNYEILDTPGIDAPIEHERIADEQLLKSDIVLFVVNPSGVVEEQATLDKLLFLIEKQKKIFLIFNEKHDLQETDRIKLKDQTYALIQEKAGQKNMHDVLKDIPIYTVNAKRALNGKKKNNTQLIEMSRILEVEQAIDRFIDDTIESNDVYSSLKTSLHNYLDGYINHLEITNNSDDVKKAYNNVLKEIATCNASVKGLAKRDIKDASYELKERVESLLLSALSGENANMEQQIEGLINQQVQRVDMSVTDALNDAILRIGKYTDELELMLPQTSSLNIRLDNFSPNHDLEKSSTAYDGTGINTSLLQSGMHIIDQLGVEGIRQSLAGIKMIAPDLMKGIGNVTMKRMAENIVRFAAPIVSVISIGMELWNEHKQREAMERQMEEERRARERYIAQCRDASRKLADDFQMNLYREWQSQIDGFFLPWQQKFQEQNEILDGESQELSLLIMQLSQLKAKLA